MIKIGWWTLFVVLEMLAVQSTATCPSKCHCENRQSEVVRQSFGIVFNCSGAGLTDTHITDDYDAKILHLELSSNQITRVDKTSFSSRSLRSVQEITLNNNTISVIEEDAFSGLSELRSLSLGSNNITTISAGVFDTNIKLAFLDLSGNTHIELPSEGFNVSSLIWFDLSRCGLKEIPPAFFNRTSNVQFVYLSHNSLTHVAPEALRAISGSVRYLDLFGNHFTRLQPELLVILPPSCKLFLYDNPYHCDCDFLKAYSVYKRRQFVSVLGCKTPDNLRRTRADELNTVLKCT